MEALRASIDARGSKTSRAQGTQGAETCGSRSILAQNRSTMRCMPITRRTSNDCSDCRRPRFVRWRAPATSTPVKRGGRLHYSFQDLSFCAPPARCARPAFSAQRINRTLRTLRATLPAGETLNKRPSRRWAIKSPFAKAGCYGSRTSGQYVLALDIGEEQGRLACHQQAGLISGCREHRGYYASRLLGGRALCKGLCAGGDRPGRSAAGLRGESRGRPTTPGSKDQFGEAAASRRPLQGSGTRISLIRSPGAFADLQSRRCCSRI